MRELDDISNTVDTSLSKLETVKDGETCSLWSCKELDTT